MFLMDAISAGYLISTFNGVAHEIYPKVKIIYLMNSQTLRGSRQVPTSNKSAVNQAPIYSSLMTRDDYDCPHGHQVTGNIFGVFLPMNLLND